MKPARHRGYGVGGAKRPVDDAQLQQGIQLVRRISFRMARRLPPNVDVDDLIGAGMEGLLKAFQAFDPQRQIPFDVYAKSRVRGAILDELRAGDTLTRYGRSRMGEITAAVSRLQHSLGREPADQEIADELRMSLEQYQKLAGDLTRAPLLAGLGAVDSDAVEGGMADPGVQYDEREMLRHLAGAIQGLPERTQQVLALYYQEECTQAEIGEILGVTESRVCQLLGDATARLRARLFRVEGRGGSPAKHMKSGAERKR